VAELRSAASRRRLPWSRQRGAAKRPDGGEDGGAVHAAAPPATASSPPGSLLEVTDLAISIPTENGLIEAVRGISLSIAPGETVGIVGESGSGKTMLALSVLGLLPRRAQVTGSVRLDGEELLQASEAHWRQVRGNRAAMVFQDPMTALNPMYSVGWQVAECLRLHQHDKKADAHKRAAELLDAVGLPEPATIARRFPHELSGGMRQRVVIAMAIANEPELLIADEPTTALDVTVQAQILDLLKSIQRETHAAMIMISHDLGVVAGIADRVLVMYAGKAVEVGGVDAVFARPRMPYTAGLLASLPSLEHRKDRLSAIRGLPPSGIGYGAGCAFAPRCPIAADVCRTEPALVPVGPSHVAACHFAVDGAGGAAPRPAAGPAAGQPPASDGAAASDAEAASRLLRSAKDHEEHQLVVEQIAGILAARCRELHVPAAPTLVPLRSIAHLGTRIEGRLRATKAGWPSVLSLVAALHPTAAVGGLPEAAAEAFIVASEAVPRDCWAGPVGWIDAAGDGDWVIGIRSALLGSSTVRLWGGGGIVADSDPKSELDETTLKLRPVLEAIAPGAGELLSS